MYELRLTIRRLYRLELHDGLKPVERNITQQGT